MGTSFQFNITAQLANIPAHITLYELLQLSKAAQDVLREDWLILIPSWRKSWSHLWM